MAFQFISVETKDHVATITLNRPEVMNALHPPAQVELGQAFDSFRDDEDQWVAIITGSGDRAFSAGNDLKHAAAAGGEIDRTGWSGGFGGITARFDLFKPIIAAVNGVALGGGFEIALASDIIVASENASFGLPEPRVGLVAGAGGMHRLPRMIPFKVAMGMMLTGKRIDAAEAYRVGLANEVVPAADLMNAARRWAGMRPDLGAALQAAGHDPFSFAPRAGRGKPHPPDRGFPEIRRPARGSSRFRGKTEAQLEGPLSREMRLSSSARLAPALRGPGEQLAAEKPCPARNAATITRPARDSASSAVGPKPSPARDADERSLPKRNSAMPAANR